MTDLTRDSLVKFVFKYVDNSLLACHKIEDVWESADPSTNAATQTARAFVEELEQKHKAYGAFDSQYHVATRPPAAVEQYACTSYVFPHLGEIVVFAVVPTK